MENKVKEAYLTRAVVERKTSQINIWFRVQKCQETVSREGLGLSLKKCLHMYKENN